MHLRAPRCCIPTQLQGNYPSESTVDEKIILTCSNKCCTAGVQPFLVTPSLDLTFTETSWKLAACDRFDGFDFEAFSSEKIRTSVEFSGLDDLLKLIKYLLLTTTKQRGWRKSQPHKALDVNRSPVGSHLHLKVCPVLFEICHFEARGLICPTGCQSFREAADGAEIDKTQFLSTKKIYNYV